jgi:hypothetical protein
MALGDEANTVAPLIASADQIKFRDYDYRTGAADVNAGRSERVPYPRRASALNGSLGPESMRQSTISYALHTEILSNGSIANYGANMSGSMNYRVGESLIYPSPSSAISPKELAVMPSSGGGGGSAVYGGSAHYGGSRRAGGTSLGQSQRSPASPGGGSSLYASLAAAGSNKAPSLPADHAPAGENHTGQDAALHAHAIALAAAAEVHRDDENCLHISGGSPPHHSSASPNSPMQPKSILKAPPVIGGSSRPGSASTLVQVAPAGSRSSKADVYAVPPERGSEPQPLASP